MRNNTSPNQISLFEPMKDGGVHEREREREREREDAGPDGLSISIMISFPLKIYLQPGKNFCEVNGNGRMCRNLRYIYWIIFLHFTKNLRRKLFAMDYTMHFA